jgi:anti-sigma factor RsiW
MTELSDELLVAYVDGQLAPAQSSAVEKVLAQDDVIARRVKAMKQAHRRLEAAFEAILAGEEADAISHPLPPSPGLLIPWDTLVKGGLAAAGIVVAIGLIFAGFGWPLAAPDLAGNAPASADNEHVGSLPKDWREEVARAQALLSRASLEIGLDSQGNRDFVAVQLGRAIGAAFAPPDLSAQKFRFTRAQILNFGGENLAQLLYLGRRGAPLALYVKKDGADAAPRLMRYGNVAGVAWSQDGIAYFLAGEEDEVSLLRLVEAVRSGHALRQSAAEDLPPVPSRSPARP